MKLFITGDSHSGSLKSGLDLLTKQDDLFNDFLVDIKQIGAGGSLTRPFFLDRGDYAELLDKTHRLRIQQIPSSGCAYDFYGFCGPLHTVRLWRHKGVWCRFSPFSGKPGYIPVSRGLLTHAIKEDQRYIMQLVALLKRVGVNVFVIEAPRPFRHHAVFKEADVDTILYVDDFYRSVMCDWLFALNVPVVNLPAHCYDDEGFMLDIYRHENPADDYHANGLFGAEMLKEVFKFMYENTVS